VICGPPPQHSGGPSKKGAPPFDAAGHRSRNRPVSSWAIRVTAPATGR
jgi:hypothetical protein